MCQISEWGDVTKVTSGSPPIPLCVDAVQRTCEVTASSPSTSDPTTTSNTIGRVTTVPIFDLAQQGTSTSSDDARLKCDQAPTRNSSSTSQVQDEDDPRWDRLRCCFITLVRYRAAWSLSTLSTGSERATWSKMGACPWWPESIDPWGYHSDIRPPICLNFSLHS